jgi:hypothetical protein
MGQRINRACSQEQAELTWKLTLSDTTRRPRPIPLGQDRRVFSLEEVNL